MGWRWLVVGAALTALMAKESSMHAKRSAPEEVPPISIGDVTFQLATSWDKQHFRCRLEATRAGKTVWQQLAYTVTLDPAREGDVQHDFPTRMTYEPAKVAVGGAKPVYPPKWFDIERESGKSVRVPINAADIWP